MSENFPVKPNRARKRMQQPEAHAAECQGIKGCLQVPEFHVPHYPSVGLPQFSACVPVISAGIVETAF